MDPRQPCRRVKKLEGMEETDGQEMSLPDLPKGTEREEQGGGQQQRRKAPHHSPEPPGCGEKAEASAGPS